MSEPCRSTSPASLLEGPLPIWTLIIWPVPLVGLNELIKHYEIKYEEEELKLTSKLQLGNVFYLFPPTCRMNVRLQKRARLEFGTKLGMNSPF